MRERIYQVGDYIRGIDGRRVLTKAVDIALHTLPFVPLVIGGLDNRFLDDDIDREIERNTPRIFMPVGRLSSEELTSKLQTYRDTKILKADYRTYLEDKNANRRSKNSWLTWTGGVLSGALILWLAGRHFWLKSEPEPMLQPLPLSTEPPKQDPLIQRSDLGPPPPLFRDALKDLDP